MLLLCLLIVASLCECSCPQTAETDVNVAGNSATSGANSAAHQTGSSTSPSSSPPPSVSTLGPQAIPRRHAPADVIARQGSFRGFPALSQKTSPFKRQLSLRMNELPSTMQRKSDFPIKNIGEFGIFANQPTYLSYFIVLHNLLINFKHNCTTEEKRQSSNSFLRIFFYYCIY